MTRTKVIFPDEESVSLLVPTVLIPDLTPEEWFARWQHESYRASVNKGAIITPRPGKPFIEWKDLDQAVKDARIEQAKFLMRMLPEFYAYVVRAMMLCPRVPQESMPCVADPQ
jgi:hypothetical protein